MNAIHFGITVEMEVRFKLIDFEPTISCKLFACNSDQAMEMVKSFFKDKVESIETIIPHK